MFRAVVYQLRVSGLPTAGSWGLLRQPLGVDCITAENTPSAGLIDTQFYKHSLSFANLLRQALIYRHKMPKPKTAVFDPNLGGVEIAQMDA
jgi:hypothetical protein